MQKTLAIKAQIENLEEKKIRIDVSPIASNLFSSLELIGLYEFIKKKCGDTKASVLYMKVVYSEKGIVERHRVLKGKFFFSIADVFDKLKEEEMKNILDRLNIAKEIGYGNKDEDLEI